MATLATSGTGNWSSTTIGSPWAALTGSGTGGVPGANDTVVISNNVTVDTNTTVGLTAFTTGGTPAIKIDTNGVTLTIGTGVSLTCVGDLLLQPPSYPNVVTVHGNAGSSLIFKPPSGQQCVCNISQVGYLNFAGSSGSHCTVITDLSNSGLNTIMTINNFRTGGPWTCTYTDFSNMGTTAAFGLYTRIEDTFPPNVSITNCTFTGCNYQLQVPADSGPWANNYTFSNNYFYSSIIRTDNNETVIFATPPTGTSGTLTISNNFFDGMVQLYYANRFTYQYNVFAGGFITSGTWSGPWTLFDSNVVVQTAAGGTEEIRLEGSVSNLYSVTTLTGDFHTFNISAGLSTFTCTGLIHEHAGGAYGLCIISGATTAQAITFNNCIGLPNSSGNQSGQLLVDFSNNTDPLINMEHNTWCNSGNGGQFGMFQGGESGAATQGIGTVASIRANLCWCTPSGATDILNWVAVDFSTSPNTNAVTTPGVGYNGFWNPTAGSCTINGSSTSTPGISDFVITNASITTAHDVSGNPGFVDAARNYQKWGVSVGLSSPTVDQVSAYLGNPTNGTLSTLITALFSYVRAGFVPTNASLENASYSGDASTSDAAGNSWTGAGPGIGAMSFAGGGGTTWNGVAHLVCTSTLTGKSKVAYYAKSHLITTNTITAHVTGNFVFTPIGGMYLGGVKTIVVDVTAFPVGGMSFGGQTVVILHGVAHLICTSSLTPNVKITRHAICSLTSQAILNGGNTKVHRSQQFTFFPGLGRRRIAK